MKLVLGTNEHWTFGRLLAEILKSGLLPDYYEECLRHFEMLALGAVKERNRPGTGHGQGSDALEVSRSLAQFAIHLAGCAGQGAAAIQSNSTGAGTIPDEIQSGLEAARRDASRRPSVVR